jgi:hypothetical protein
MVRRSKPVMHASMRRHAGSDRGTGEHQMDRGPGHLQCPFCGAYEVDRLYVGSLNIDACTCDGCGARWDEDAETGRYRGRGDVDSVIAPRGR